MKAEVHHILKIYFERKKVTYPQYSLRALARDLEVSPAYASAILAGKKPLPESRLKDFIKVLDLDDIAILQLKKAIFPEDKKEVNLNGNLLGSDDLDFFNKYKPLDKKKYEILNDWYNVAIMDLTTCQGFESNPEWIAKKLKISRLEVEIAIWNLKLHNLLVEQDGKLQKVELKLRFPTKISQTVIRKFHKQMIKKAYEELDLKTEDSEFDKRLISGATFALNESKIKLLKEKIQNAIYEVSSMASEGPCQSIYQLNVQFFPLSESSTKS
jgi:uncharacterized protein (TIGR02147 family)